MSERVDDIVRAAIEVFSTYGVQKSSMTDIARAAQVSRQTLYTHFRSRDDVFLAAAQALHDETLGRVRTAAAGDAPAVDRLVAMFVAKIATHVELVRTSPHGQQLLDEHTRLGGQLTAAADEEFRALVASVLRSEPRPRRRGLSMPKATALLCDLLLAAEVVALRRLDRWQRDVELLVRTAYDGVFDAPT